MSTPSVQIAPNPSTVDKPRRRWWRKARRAVFNLLCVASALLCLITIIFGVRGYWFIDNLKLEDYWYSEPNLVSGYTVDIRSFDGHLAGEIITFEKVGMKVPPGMSVGFHTHENNITGMVLFRFETNHATDIFFHHAQPGASERWT